MQADFEERTFEHPLNHQLLGRQRRLFVPGQVLEQYVGFDAALVATYPYFWRLWGTTRPPGLAVNSAVATPHARRAPSFRANLFVQHKRPHHMRRSSATEWPYWGREYFRFDIVDHQQQALEAVAARARGRAIVCYACPAFAKAAELFDHIDAGTLVENTHFAKVPPLRNHRRYSYVDARTPGRPHSEHVEPEKPLDLDQAISNAGDLPPVEKTGSHGGDGGEDNIVRLIGRIVQATAEDQRNRFEVWDGYFRLVETLTTRVQAREPGDLETLIGFIRVGIFEWIVAADWFVVGDQDRDAQVGDGRAG